MLDRLAFCKGAYSGSTMEDSIGLYSGIAGNPLLMETFLKGSVLNVGC